MGLWCYCLVVLFHIFHKSVKEQKNTFKRGQQIVFSSLCVFVANLLILLLVNVVSCCSSMEVTLCENVAMWLC